MTHVLILGGEGMLGHSLVGQLSGSMNTTVTVRSIGAIHPYLQRLPGVAFYEFNAEDFQTFGRLTEDVLPNVIVNCIGVVKQRGMAKEAIPSISTNSLFPHQLADCCVKRGIRLIHISTDCVFSGNKGNYTEDDIPDPIDLYGRSKLLGEVTAPGCLTLRTSIIGWELKHFSGLLEWFASQRGKEIRGFHRAIYSGLSTRSLSQLLKWIILQRQDLTGLYQVATQPISKHELLTRLRDKLGWMDVRITSDDVFVCDRSLKCDRFVSETGWQAPSWGYLIAELANEQTLYQKFRS